MSFCKQSLPIQCISKNREEKILKQPLFRCSVQIKGIAHTVWNGSMHQYVIFFRSSTNESTQSALTRLPQTCHDTITLVICFLPPLSSLSFHHFIRFSTSLLSPRLEMKTKVFMQLYRVCRRWTNTNFALKPPRQQKTTKRVPYIFLVNIVLK